jgi:ABC-type transport system involved in cytochrome c biogenesis permease component
MNFVNIANVEGPDLGAITPLIFAAVVGLVVGFSVGGDAELYFARPAAGFSLIVALLLAGSIVRFERRQ